MLNRPTFGGHINIPGLFLYIYTYGLGDAVKLVNKKSANHSYIAYLQFEYCKSITRIV